MRSRLKVAFLRCPFFMAALYFPFGLAQSPTQNLPTAPTHEATLSAPGRASADVSPNLTQLRAMIDRGRSEDALKRLDALAAEKPVQAGGYRLRGLALYSENDFTDADIAFASALKQDSHDQESAQLRGLTLFRMGRPADASQVSSFTSVSRR